MTDKITYCRGKKFDLQLSDALINERRLGEIFEAAIIKRVELKSEQWQWEQTGNICVEYRWKDDLSGISVTEADYWVHELRRDGRTLVYLMFPIERIKELARDAIRRGQCRRNAGDDGLSSVVLIKLRDILK